MFAPPFHARARNRPYASRCVDPASHATRSLRFFGPDGFEHTNDVCSLDRLYRQATDDRIRIGRQRVRPLRSMLLIAPCSVAALLRSNVALRSLLEGDLVGEF